MKRKITMSADELKLGMLVHAPSWTDAPDRVAPIVELDVGYNYTTIKVDGAMKFLRPNSDYVTVVEL